jgi:hypothetical protein
MPDGRILREQAREAMKRGRLPARPADRASGGPGVGALCSVCNLPVRNSVMEMQIEFAGKGEPAGVDTYHVHLPCFAAWEFERGNAQSV